MAGRELPTRRQDIQWCRGRLGSTGLLIASQEYAIYTLTCRRSRPGQVGPPQVGSATGRASQSAVRLGCTDVQHPSVDVSMFLAERPRLEFAQTSITDADSSVELCQASKGLWCVVAVKVEVKV